jgi:hypothetical protein
LPSEQQPGFKANLIASLAQFSLVQADAMSSIILDDSKRHQMPGVVSLAIPSLAEFANLPEEEQQLFKSSFESLSSREEKRKWIELHILGVLPCAMKKKVFFLPINKTDYILIYTKGEFARVLGITRCDDVPIFFGKLKVPPMQAAAQVAAVAAAPQVNGGGHDGSGGRNSKPYSFRQFMDIRRTVNDDIGMDTEAIERSAEFRAANHALSRHESSEQVRRNTDACSLPPHNAF